MKRYIAAVSGEKEAGGGKKFRKNTIKTLFFLHPFSDIKIPMIKADWFHNTRSANL
jgi:hypothetical protein